MDLYLYSVQNWHGHNDYGWYIFMMGDQESGCKMYGDLVAPCDLDLISMTGASVF
jgi:hypothetical protein